MNLRKKKLGQKILYSCLIAIALVAIFAVILNFDSQGLQSKAPDSNLTPQINDSDSVSAPKFSFLAAPIRESFYLGGRAVIATTIVSNKTQNYYLSGEWLAYDNILNHTLPIPESKYNATFYLEKGRLAMQYRWKSIFENSSGVIFTANLTDDSGKIYPQNVSISLIKNDDVLPYLTENPIIRSNDTMTIFALLNIRAANSDGSSQAASLLEAARKYLSRPKEENMTEYFEKNDVDSLEVFEKREGTSSEYSAFYAALLRSMGIPAKVMKCGEANGTYYYAEAFIDKRGWINVDVYDAEKRFGDSPDNCTNKTAAY
jgi:hypothetical protein